MFSRVPSVKTLRTIYDDATAKALRRLLTGKDNPEDTSPSTAAWVRQCYHAPPERDVITHAANALAGTYGVEAIGLAADADRYDVRPFCEYLNTGDTYGATLLFFRSGVVRIGTWGDVVEAQERRGRKVA